VMLCLGGSARYRRERCRRSAVKQRDDGMCPRAHRRDRGKRRFSGCDHSSATDFVRTTRTDVTTRHEQEFSTRVDTDVGRLSNHSRQFEKFGIIGTGVAVQLQPVTRSDARLLKRFNFATSGASKTIELRPYSKAEHGPKWVHWSRTLETVGRGAPGIRNRRSVPGLLVASHDTILFSRLVIVHAGTTRLKRSNVGVAPLPGGCCRTNCLTAARSSTAC
jgi:hypothetical protein